MNALGKRRRIVEREARREERGLEQEVRQISDGLVSLVLCDLAVQLLDDRVVGVQFQRLFRRHVR